MKSDICFQGRPQNLDIGFTTREGPNGANTPIKIKILSLYNIIPYENGPVALRISLETEQF